ncbi:hypothetical protein NUM3379_14110 [Kineococcus sp. NUM-3379]
MAARRPTVARTTVPARPPSAPRAPRRPGRARRLGLWLVGLLTAGLVLGVGAFVAAYAFTTIPDPNELAEAQVSTVYHSDGTTPIGRFVDADGNRVPVTIDQVPEPVQRAVLAAEDRSFYENRGVSPTGIARAFWNNVRGGDTQGGSTITQQYVKNYFLSADQSYTRKFKEFFIALKVDEQQSKGETLADYLNTVYFGRRAYGIQTASQAYFGKDVGQLTVSEGAVLAGLLAAPSSYDPKVNPQAAERRWNYVMDGMVEEGWLTAAERAATTMPPTIDAPPNRDLEGPNGYLLATVKAELQSEAVGLTEEEIDRGGLKIVTTFDPAVQRSAEEAVRENLPEKVPAGLRVGLVSIDPRDGGVRAMYGGADYLRNQLNAVTQAQAQAGSTFKPFTLVAALEKGVSLRSTFNGNSPLALKSWGKETVENFGDTSQGRQDLMAATASSTNTVYAQLNDIATPAGTKAVAVRAGGFDPKTLSEVPSNVLGSDTVRPINMAQAYATFAAQGVRRTWHTVAQVSDPTGKVTYKASPREERVFEEGVAADATYAMQQVVQRGSGSYAKRLGRPAAGKTGTSTSNRSAWFAGYTPQLATVVVMFQQDEAGNPVPLRVSGVREVTGGSYPVRMWTSHMRTALEGQEELDFPRPRYVGKARGGGSSTSTPSRTRSTSRPSSTSSSSSAPSQSSSPSSPEASPSSPTGSGTPSQGATSGSGEGGGGDGGSASPQPTGSSGSSGRSGGTPAPEPTGGGGGGDGGGGGGGDGGQTPGAAAEATR